MANISSTFGEIGSALGRPALALLTRKSAPTVLAIFSAAFTGSPIPAEQFLNTVRNQLNVLAEDGLSDLLNNGAISVRGLVNAWVNEQWLLYSTTAEGGEEYALTSHSQTALDYVGRAGRSRAMVSQSRIRSILEAARECAEAANPDKGIRIARLQSQIDNLTSERDRLMGGGELTESSDDHVLEAYLNLKELLDQLPADFLRVSEAVEAEQRRILLDFQSESVSTGSVVSQYLDRAAESLAQTQEGRAFQGAQELLRDSTLMDQLRRDVDATLNHPVSETLTQEERKALRSTPHLMELNVGAVLSKRHQNTRTIQHYVTRHTSSTDREVSSLIRKLKSALFEWAPTGRGRDDVPVAVHLAQSNFGHLQQRYYDPSDHRPPRPIGERVTGGDIPSLNDLLRHGGPRIEALKGVLTAALARSETITAAEAFNSSAPELRRPVEILGYLQLGERIGPISVDGSTEVYCAVRPDGTVRNFRAAKVVFTRDHSDMLEISTEIGN
jgi:hypothetical protein